MSFQRIACCIDFSEHADAAFLTAVEMAERNRAKLSLIHVVPPEVNPVLTDTGAGFSDDDQRSLIQQIEERMAAEYGARISEGVDYELVVSDGHVSSEIIRHLTENQIDLVVMGSYGLTGVGLVVFGSVAKRVAHKAPCSVMIVRPKGESPDET